MDRNNSIQSDHKGGSQMTTSLSFLRIIAICAGSGVVELLIAVKGSYFVPAINDGGVVSREYGSMLLVCGPFIVLFFQNYLGAASDRCSCQWGRRKPFILGIVLAVLVGLVLFPFSKDLANLADTDEERQWIYIVITLISTVTIEFNVSSLQVPLRALLLDVLPQKQLVTGNIIYPLVGLLGATVVFGIGSVSWSSIFSLPDTLSVQVKFVCGLSVLLTAVLTLITLCSVREQPHQQNTEVKWVTSNNAKSNSVEGGKCDIESNQINNSQDNQKNFMSYDNITMLPYGSLITDKQNNCCTVYNSIVENLYFIRCMSLSAAMLYTSVFFTMVALFTQLVFFTHYVGEVIFNGDVFAHDNSTAYRDYTDGVKTGSLILAISSASGFFILLLLRPAIKCVGIRPLFVIPYVLMMLQSGILIINHSLIVAIILSPAIYISLLHYLTFPPILISMYQTKGLLVRESWPYPDATLMGKACSFMMIATDLGKILTLLLNGPLMKAYGSAVSVMIIACVCSFVGALVACFVTVPSATAKKNKSNKTLGPVSVTKSEHQADHT